MASDTWMQYNEMFWQGHPNSHAEMGIGAHFTEFGCCGTHTASTYFVQIHLMYGFFGALLNGLCFTCVGKTSELLATHH